MEKVKDQRGKSGRKRRRNRRRRRYLEGGGGDTTLVGRGILVENNTGSLEDQTSILGEEEVRSLDDDLEEGKR